MLPIKGVSHILFFLVCFISITSNIWKFINHIFWVRYLPNLQPILIKTVNNNKERNIAKQKQMILRNPNFLAIKYKNDQHINSLQPNHEAHKHMLSLIRRSQTFVAKKKWRQSSHPSSAVSAPQGTTLIPASHTP